MWDDLICSTAEKAQQSPHCPWSRTSPREAHLVLQGGARSMPDDCCAVCSMAVSFFGAFQLVACLEAKQRPEFVF